MSAQYETESSLGQAIFGHAQLGDQRRTARLVETFDLMRQHPGGTLPDKLASPADLRAFYRLCDCQDVTHAAVIEAIRQHTLAQIAACQGSVLIIHDATELDYTSLASLADDLGQIGKGTGRGYICQMDVQAQRGRKARKSAAFIVRGGPVLVCPPHAKHGNHGDQPLPMYVVQVTEVALPLARNLSTGC